MRVRSVVLSVVAIAIVLLSRAAPASAGGCGEPASHGSGTTVVIKNACFAPSLLSVDPGDTVTFVNRDPIAHNVGGQLWGHFEDLDPSQRFQATFDRDGIYPYACIIHPGMTGAIVVGDGVGAGNGRSVTVRPVQAPVPASPAAFAAPGAGTDTGTVLPAAVIALVVGLAIGAGVTTYRRPREGRLTPRSVHP